MMVMQALFVCIKTTSRVVYAVFSVVPCKCSEGKSPQESYMPLPPYEGECNDFHQS